VHALYLASVTLHILAAMTWTGGLVFIAAVAVPLLRRGDRLSAAKFLRESGTRFRAVSWACFAILAVTGVVNLTFRGVTLADFVDPSWLAGAGLPIALKLAAFAALLALSAAHDFVLGPRASIESERDPTSPASARLRRSASLIGRIEAVLTLAIVALAVVVVRGWP
jgi:putative copper export protein